ncbi:MAG: 2-C-methyl-D-erythritol 2,4-cyclodiphosphate synthase [Acetobacterium sp.]|nr:2-C-methyl-D-erythritol 2,4-cyclodiphosphate synthase [Acetobacterium sp.]
MIRVGIGYDVHRLVEERPLILGGVKIEHPLGLLGHSDADVLVHAIIDALLGALALGDIGKHFPDTDGAYKDCDSLQLLKKVGQLVAEKGYRVNNIDSTIIAQAPKLAPYIEIMVENIRRTLDLSGDCVSVKATTEEGLGFTGSEQGIAANAVVSLLKGEISK